MYIVILNSIYNDETFCGIIEITRLSDCQRLQFALCISIWRAQTAACCTLDGALKIPWQLSLAFRWNRAPCELRDTSCISDCHATHARTHTPRAAAALLGMYHVAAVRMYGLRLRLRQRQRLRLHEIFV